MTWQIVSAQSSGMRHEQQDDGGAWTSRDGKSVLAVIADGAGGHHGGRQAALTAVATARKLWKNVPPTSKDARDFLEKISRSAHEAVAKEARSERSSRTTWVALLAFENEAHWVHSGDSRLYHFSSGKLSSRTVDHSLIQALLEQGKVTEAQIRTHPDRAILLQSLGGPHYAPVESGFAKIGRDDLFILCTDGVFGDINEDELRQLAVATRNQRTQLVKDLVQMAVKRGGKRADNATLWCIFR